MAETMHALGKALMAPESYVQEAIGDAVVQSVLCVTWFFVYRHLFILPFLTKEDNRQKRQAWVLTLLAASIGSFAGTIQLFRLLKAGWVPELVLVSPREWRCVTHFFMVYFVWDWIFALRYYPDFFDFLTGYAHHIFYFAASIGFLYYECTSAFISCLLMEYSSCFMSVGSCHPHLRSDIGFGVTFFLFRILFHVFVVYQFFIAGNPLWIVGAAPLIIHLIWFKNWCSSYLFGGKKEKKKQQQQRQQQNGSKKEKLQ